MLEVWIQASQNYYVIWRRWGKWKCSHLSLPWIIETQNR